MQLISNFTKSITVAVLIAFTLMPSYLALTPKASGFEFIQFYPNEEATLSASVEKSNATIWDQIRSEFVLDHRTELAPVQREIRRLLSDPDRIYSILKAASPYMYYIYKQTHARNLPMELALIPFIESEFNPNDRSHKGALGLWQLMPQTARELGVKVKRGRDDRKDLAASTHAALAYFNDLGNEFNGNWYLAIAAYNCGQGCVESAKRRTGTENFWKLPVPTETKYYVPRLLAIAEIVENPNKYGIELPPIDNKGKLHELPIKDLPIKQTALALNKPRKQITPMKQYASENEIKRTAAYKDMFPVCTVFSCNA